MMNTHTWTQLSERSSLFYIRILFLAFLLSLAGLSVVRADAFEIVFEPYKLYEKPARFGINGNAGKFLRLEALYDEETHVLQWITEFEPKPGTSKIPVGFYLMLNGGGDAVAADGVMPMLYFDATDFDQPKLTVYAANGTSNPKKSWGDGAKARGDQAPDLIASSLRDPDFALELIAEKHGDRVRLGFVIDASIINEHSPLYPDLLGRPWQGIGFGTELGIWFHPVVGLITEYHDSGSEAGFLKSWGYGPISVAAGTDLKYVPPGATRISSHPICTGGGGPITIVPGAPIEAIFKGIKTDQDGLLRVQYEGLPPEAAFSIDAGTVSQSPVVTTLRWTPPSVCGGVEYTVRVQFIDSLGRIAECPLTLKVANDNSLLQCKYPPKSARRRRWGWR